MSQLNRMPEEPEWAEWLQHPCTKRLRTWAAQQRQDLMEGWAGGNFSAAFTMEMAVKNAGATGACSAYADIVELDYNQIVTGAADEQLGINTTGPSSSGGTV